MPEDTSNGNSDRRLFALIGYPLSHSFSGEYFSRKFETGGVANCEYKLFPIESISQLPDILARHPNLRGLNITIPYKESVLAYLDRRDSLVDQIGACNCIRIDSGKLTGFNTDAIGFEFSLREMLLPSHGPALVLGTGGAAKAVAFVLKKLGIDFRYVSRNASNGMLSYETLTAAIVSTHTLIINTTPLGMHPNIHEAPRINYDAIGSTHYLYDLVYNPAQTLFLEKGKTRGATTKNGYDMLVKQAEESWRIWNS